MGPACLYDKENGQINLEPNNNFITTLSSALLKRFIEMYVTECTSVLNSLVMPFHFFGGNYGENHRSKISEAVH